MKDRDRPPKPPSAEETKVLQEAREKRMADAARIFDAVRGRPIPKDMLPSLTPPITNKEKS